MRLKIRRIGGEVGIALPKKLVRRFDLRSGEYVELVEAPGGLLLQLQDFEVN